MCHFNDNLKVLSLAAYIYYFVLGVFLGFIHANNIIVKKISTIVLLMIVFPICSLIIATISIDIRDSGFFDVKFAEPIVYKMYMKEVWYDSFRPYFYLNRFAYDLGSSSVFVPTTLNYIIALPLVYGCFKYDKDIIAIIAIIFFLYFSAFSLRDVLMSFALTTFCMVVVRYKQDDLMINKSGRFLFGLIGFIVLVFSRPELMIVIMVAIALSWSFYKRKYLLFFMFLFLFLFFYSNIYELAIKTLGMEAGGEIVHFIEGRYERHAFSDSGGGSHIMGGDLLKYPIMLRLVIQIYSTVIGAVPTDLNVSGVIYTVYSLSLIVLLYKVIKVKKNNQKEYFVAILLVCILVANIPFASNYGNLLRMKVILIPPLLYLINYFYFEKSL